MLEEKIVISTKLKIIKEQERHGFESWTVYWMDMTFFSLICCKKLYCLLEITENKQKRGRGWPFKKQLSSKIFLDKTNLSSKLDSLVQDVIVEQHGEGDPK